MTVEKDGFDSAAIKAVRITIDQKQLVNFRLKVGAVATMETVTAAPTMLQTESAETGEVIQSHEILDLPLLGRTFYELTLLTAGVSYGAGNTNAFNFSVNGQREYANSIQIDGVESTTNRTQDIPATPSVDSVEEFKVSTSTAQRRLPTLIISGVYVFQRWRRVGLSRSRFRETRGLRSRM